MRLRRAFGLAAVAAGCMGMALVSPATLAQAPKAGLAGGKDAFRKDVPKPNSNISERFLAMKVGSVAVEAKGANGKQNLADMKATSDYYLSRLTHREYFTSSIERKESSGKVIDLAPPGTDGSTTLDSILTEFTKTLVFPDANTKLATYNSEFIIEYGLVVDASINALLNDPSNPPPIVKLNIARALTIACKTGATAHAKTVLTLLTDAKTPWYLKYEALKSAENLIGAHDVLALQGPTPHKHSIPDKDLADLCNAIEANIKKLNTMVLASEPPPPAPPAKPGAIPAAAPPAAPVAGGKLDAPLTPELDPDVALFIRKQAVKALAKVRLIVVPGPNRTVLASPGVTLARYAVKDPSVRPVPSTMESADAAMGLTGVYLENNVNIDVFADAIAAGVTQFGGAKFEAGGQTTESKLIPWKKVASQMNAAMNSLKMSPDKNPVANSNRQLLTSLANICSLNVLTPMETAKDNAVGAALNPAAIDDFRFRQSPRKTDLLIQNDPTSKITYPTKR